MKSLCAKYLLFTNDEGRLQLHVLDRVNKKRDAMVSAQKEQESNLRSMHQYILYILFVPTRVDTP